MEKVSEELQENKGLLSSSCLFSCTLLHMCAQNPVCAACIYIDRRMMRAEAHNRGAGKGNEESDGFILRCMITSSP